MKRLGSDVMLLGVSARQHIGLPGAALTTVAIMRSPDFVPQFHVHWSERLPWIELADDLPRHEHSSS